MARRRKKFEGFFLFFIFLIQIIEDEQNLQIYNATFPFTDDCFLLSDYCFALHNIPIIHSFASLKD